MPLERRLFSYIFEDTMRVKIYIISPSMLEAVIQGRATITNLPKDAKLYKVLLWRPEDADDMLSLWFMHDDFAEVPEGNIVEQVWAHAVDVE